MSLGDASLVIGAGGKNARIVCTHNIDFIEYLRWKFSLLGDLWVNKNVYIFNNGVNNGARLFTKADPIITEVQKELYNGYSHKKCITKSILNRIDDLGMCIWYMDDGSLTKIKYKPTGNIQGYRVRLATDCFTFEENTIIAEWLFEKYGAKFNIAKSYDKRNTKTYYQLSAGLGMVLGMLEKIKPYHHDTMNYKFDYKLSGRNSTSRYINDK